LLHHYLDSFHFQLDMKTRIMPAFTSFCQ